ncbi:uncharacterized protein LOC131891152 [Tigriopus californicus]|uniref:uncharacterized protein LOC131891152 n=1 Tax=Tigriopus californicus TaxID=6832 RepID=UPI0027DA5A97|nr:uncharacterized protein LOC131891152 [Tigriopus californicus]
MKTIGAFFTLAYVLGPILAIPVDLNDEVEFVEPVNTNADSPVTSEGIPAQIPILVIRTGNPFFGSFGGSGFPGLRPKSQDEPSANGAGSFLGFEDIFNSFFGPSRSNTEADYDGDFDDTVNLRPLDEAIPTSGTPQCGLICQIMNQFQGQIATIEKEIHDIREKEQERENEIEVDRVDSQEDQDNEPQHTYEEKILPDGSIVRINRTVLTDRNGDGSAFIFHSTSFHNILSPEDHADDGPSAAGDDSNPNNDEATDFEDVDPK